MMQKNYYSLLLPKNINGKFYHVILNFILLLEVSCNVENYNLNHAFEFVSVNLLRFSSS